MAKKRHVQPKKEDLGFIQMFSDRGTNVAKAEEYMLMLAKASGGNDAALITACMVYHNTFVLWLLKNYKLTPKK